VDLVATVILFLLMFTVIIAVHEFGHYLTARLLGMKVLEFAFGFPPRVAAIRHAEIDYSINAIPFGGFVRILGQDDFAIHQAGEGAPGSFTSKPWWAQAIVLAAGVTMNMVLALFVLTLAFATGTTGSTGDVRVRSVAPDSPAQRAAIQVGDIVRSIDGRPITRSGDLVSYVTSQARLRPGQEVTLEIDRNGRPLAPIKAVPRTEPPEGEGPLGISLEEVQGQKTYTLPEAFREAVSLSGEVVVQIAELPGQLLAPRAGQAAPSVGGPIEILRVTGQVAQFGLPAFLKLVGVLSVNLAVLNIVPFPGLDGGRLFFVLLGGIFRVRLSPQVEAAVHAVGFVLLLLLLVVVSIADIRRVVGG
jgi:regulator of sigma E protease